MACCSQLRSLMKKNAILWYRHICWSICELLFPIILFAIILIFRIRIKMVDHDQEDYLSLASSATPTPGKPYYNSAQLMLDLSAQNKMLNIFELQLPFLSCAKYKKTVFAFVNADSDNVMTLVKNKLTPYFTLLKNTQDITATTQDFDSEEKLEAYVKDLNYGNTGSGAMELPTICAAIVKNKSENGNYIYDIRMDDDSRSNKSIIPTTKTRSVNIISKNPNLKTFTNLANSGYTYLQMLIANSILQTELGNPNAKMQFAYVPMRTNSFLEDTFLSRLKAFMPMFIVLMYIVPIFRMISAVVGEKETKIRESMKMMGLKDSTYWLSWVLYFACIIFVISILVTVICSSKLFKYSNFVTLWLFFFLYGLDVVALSLFIASIFNKSRVASIVGSLIYFGTYFISLVVSDEGVSSSSKYGSSLLPTVCVSLLTNYLISYESTQTPLTFKNMGNVMDNYTYSMGLGMLAIDFIIFILLALYFDNALPKEFGIRKSVCFFFTPSYWKGPKSVEPNLRKISTTDPDKGFKSLYDHPDFEEADNSLRLQEKTKECLRIIELTKKFGEKNAVENLTVTMYKNQIFALLGHNGAGKTTTLSVLTGLIEQTGGLSFIDGVNIMNDRNYFRKILGICPQHNILFEDLTPKEHLKMFAIFKGSSASDQEIEKMIHDIGLDESKNTLAKNLSGGMKRKLSIGIAFIGGSRVILLDEPTSGMDLTARRKVWEMLKNYKSNRVIILTTHYMDEADYLGDRIGIMSGGKLACLGTSFFLKKKFGVGYNLTVVMKKEADNKEVKNFIKSCIPIAIEKDDGGNDLHYQFNNSDQFPEESVPKFFKELENKKDELGISSYGLSATTLEDVFMNSNVAQRKAEADKAEKTETKIENTDTQAIFELTESRMKNAFCLHLKYGFWKRWKNLSRNLSGLLLILIVPILLMIAGLSLTLIRVYYDSPLIDYGASHFPIPQDVIINSGSSVDLDGFIANSEPNVSYQKYTITSVDQMNQLEEINNYIFDNRAHDPYRYGSVYISNLNKAAAQLSAVLFVNISSIDSTAAITQIIERQAIRFFKEDLNVTIRNHPLPLTLEARSKEAFKNSNQVSFMYNIAFSIIPAILVSFIVLEKESNLKHQQMISGMSLASYWLSNFLYDIIFNLILASIGIGLLYAFDVDITYSYATILMYEVSIISFSYVSSFIFKSESIAMNVTLGVHMFCGILLGPVFMILRQFEDTQLAADVLVWPLRIIPSFAFADALLSITNVNLFALAYNMTTVPSNLSFRIGGGGSWLFLGIDFVLSWIILILVESRVFIKGPRINEKAYLGYINNEKDVKEEENKLIEDSEKNYSIHAIALRKEYKIGCKSKKVAVQKASIGLKQGEVFALLGTNGAGKTTTFKMLTFEVMPTSGLICINGLNIHKNFNQIRQAIGYCPQFDTLFPYLTVYENLIYYACIKKIMPNERKLAIQNVIHELSLHTYTNIQAGKLSGGNKRKLSVAIAMIGNPSILLLDEPSTGMDPEARRFMWEVISKISKKRQHSSVIITTHSMEEAEALASKIGIMSNGKFRCIGSAQHLKSIYGEGYEICVRVVQPTQHEIQEHCEKCGLQLNSLLDFENTKILMGKSEMSCLINEIVEKGTGSDFKAEFDSGRMVRAEYVSLYIMIEKIGMQIEKELLNMFENYDLIEHYFSTYKYKVPRSKHLSEIFELLCKLKKQGLIMEYSVTQTSLEQIFNAFALEDENQLFRKISKKDLPKAQLIIS